MEEACSSRTLRDYQIMSNNLRILPTHQTTTNHTMSAVNSQSLSTALTVISANIEGLTASKVSILSEMYKRERGHCLCLQETHKPTNLSRPKIAGMSLVVELLEQFSASGESARFQSGRPRFYLYNSVH